MQFVMVKLDSDLDMHVFLTSLFLRTPHLAKNHRESLGQVDRHIMPRHCFRNDTDPPLTLISRRIRAQNIHKKIPTGVQVSHLIYSQHHLP